ncbi:alpha/beta fold hydrolase [Rhodococcus sp. IEGM 1409]|uniref:esterase/lipase family protein n=1 Tax=Rhodococcus sp. IEGM 1409 TaxID=3047082 RepID=UPI0024B737E0|nr:alpha/beta fold hydrolase [Rhodococcus sp. IEGM 1409]MDI9899381.1 alpha/beta fold hydrolase [Rhodococcus sp. IEGM 1409]
MKRFTLVTLASLAACAVLAGTPAAVSADPAEPTPGLSSVAPSPVGANDWGCKPSLEHPRPVVLVHGTGMSMTDTWDVLAPQLADLGYCVFALNYGGVREILNPNAVHWGITDIATSAEELAVFVDSVKFHTGATQVDIVGHSQGGVVARQYLKFNGGATPADPSKNAVHSLVSLGATNHGTTFGGLQANARSLSAMGLPGDLLVQAIWGPAGVQQLSGTPFLTALNAGSETQPDIEYTVIASAHDEISTPPEATFLSPGDGAIVHNVWTQDNCAGNAASHGQLVSDPHTLDLVKSALDPEYRPLPCE